MKATNWLGDSKEFFWALVACVLILVALLAELAYAEPRRHGQDFLGLARQDVKMLKENTEPGQCIGTLAGTFGGIIDPLDQLFKTDKYDCLRVHLTFCDHGRKCQPGECDPTSLACLEGKALALKKLVKKHPEVTLKYVSYMLEYQTKDRKLVDSQVKMLRRVLPDWKIVASILPGAYVPSGVLVERHGNTPQLSHITSNDGANYFDANTWEAGNAAPIYRTRATEVSFAWRNRDNLRLTSEKGAPLPPKQRPLSNRLEPQDIVQSQLTQKPLAMRPVAPAACSGSTVLSKLRPGELWKVRSEDYGAKNDSRGNKPLFIARSSAGRMKVLDQEGAEIACLKYYGPYADTGLGRFYLGSCSGDTGLSLYNKNKKREWVWINDGKNCWGVSALRRMGYYRD